MFRVERVLKADALGRVELGWWTDDQSAPPVRAIRRVTARGWAGWIARALLRREARALLLLGGACEGAHRPLTGVAQRLAQPDASTLIRSYIEGVPLHQATHLPRNFFDLLADLTRELHARGVAHNDLHKEPNVLVTPAGRPALVDFQLASLHAPGARALQQRAAEDLRHVDKHRARYEARDGARRSTAKERGPLARVWMATGKRVYNWLTRRVLKRSDSEGRRPPKGPWPEWEAPLAREHDEA